jgi:dienelactone hydrolase
VIRVPVEVQNIYGKTVSQDIVVTLFHKPSAVHPKPVLIINHGRSTQSDKRASMGRVRYLDNAHWFVSLGFLVVVPTRVGYGETGGEDVEDSGGCHRRNFRPVYAAAAHQTRVVLQEVQKRSDTRKDLALVVGQSVGGVTSLAVAALNLPGVQAVINFAGGGGGDPKSHPQDPCSEPTLKALIKSYGQTARAPTLWLYTENDQYFGHKLPRTWFDAFQQAGGQGEFVVYPPHGQDGHSLFSTGPEVWKPKVLEFLKANASLAEVIEQKNNSNN